MVWRDRVVAEKRKSRQVQMKQETVCLVARALYFLDFR